MESRKGFFQRTSLVADASFRSSIPLIVPNDMQYDSSSNTLRKIPDVNRNSVCVVDESLQLLSSIKKPIAVLSISGPYRSGKSYVLSRFLGSQDAFQLGHTTNAQTFGIWMGTTILECDQYAIVLLDTEGIDAVASAEEADASILVLTILLSSYFIYNSLSVPRKQDLEKMSMFLQLASSIAIRQNEESDINELQHSFPDFLWLLRDVHLLPVNEKGQEISATDYLKKNVLVRGKGFFESKTDAVARAILAFFPTVECRTLPPPSTSPDVMQDIGKNVSQLNPAFNLGIEKLVTFLENVVKVKRGFGYGSINGSMLVSLVNEYVRAINTPGAIPILNDAWVSTVNLEQRKIITDFVEDYTCDVKKCITQAGGFPMEEEGVSDDGSVSTLMAIHRQVLSSKVKKLIEAASLFVQPGKETEDLIKKLEDQVVVYESTPYNHDDRVYDKKSVVGGALYTFIVENAKKSKEQCRRLINDLYKPIRNKVDAMNPDFTFKNLLEDLAEMSSKYFSQAKGPAKWEVYNQQKQDMESDKEKFTQLKEYEVNLQKAAEDAEKVKQENACMAEQVNALRSQVIQEAEIHKAKLEEMNKVQEEAIRRIQIEEQERQACERKKLEEFQQAQMEEMAKITKEYQAEKEKEQQMMLEMMKEQQEMNMKAIEKMVLEAQTAPPPQAERPAALININFPLGDQCRIS